MTYEVVSLESDEEPAAGTWCKVAIKLIKIDDRVICVEFMRIYGAQIVFLDHYEWLRKEIRILQDVSVED